MFELDYSLNEMEQNSAGVLHMLNTTFYQIYQQTAFRYPNLTLLSTALLSLGYVLRNKFTRKPDAKKMPEEAPGESAELAELRSSLDQLLKQQGIIEGELKQETALLVHFLKLFKTHAGNQEALYRKVESLEQIAAPLEERVEELVAKFDTLALNNKPVAQDDGDIADLERLDDLKKSSMRQRRISEKRFK
ncbi:MAG: hypothetical protein AB7I18_11560 [Candidatus Berkiella sp.]